MKRIVKVNKGDRYNRLTIIKEVDPIERNGRRKRYVLCKCDCGNIGTHRLEDMRAGKIKSCGCYNHEKNTKHGLSNTRIYNIWRSMLSRCNNPKDDSYNSYGAKGIKVCDKWKDLKTFYNWASKSGYNDDLSIERLDNNKGYSPSNCKWIPLKEQANNTNRSFMITYKGETMNLKQWAERLNIKYSTLKNRFRLGWSVESAFNTNPADYRLRGSKK